MFPSVHAPDCQNIRSCIKSRTYLGASPGVEKDLLHDTEAAFFELEYLDHSIIARAAGGLDKIKLRDSNFGLAGLILKHH